MIVNDEDRHFMKVAIDEAHRAYEEDEVPIGAVVVSKGRIIGRGHNLTEKLNDVTAHAEMQAITAAANYLGGKYLDDCTLYVTVEPCIMCAGDRLESAEAYCLRCSRCQARVLHIHVTHSVSPQVGGRFGSHGGRVRRDYALVFLA